MAKGTTRSIRAQPAVWDALYEAAEQRGVSPNALAAQLIMAGLEPSQAQEPQAEQAVSQSSPGLLARWWGRR